MVIRRALASDAAVVHRLLLEAAAWVDALGVVMWEDGELEFDDVEREVLAGQFFVADVNGMIAGAIRFQTEDRLFWPDLHAGGLGLRAPAGRQPRVQGCRGVDRRCSSGPSRTPATWARRGCGWTATTIGRN